MKIIKFGAEWCPGCLVMKPRWEELETELAWLETEYYDFDKDKEEVNEYQINSVLPVAIFLDKEGKELLRLNGEQSKKKLIETINEYKDL
ncbi:MAG: TlpA family protein disulfide reductase [Patescibacteria group bacterium]|jgi:thiol-disulfide isomerase/thioredoxin